MSASASGQARSLDIGKVLTDGLNVLAQNFGTFFLLALLLQGIPQALAAWGQVMGAANPIGGAFVAIGGLAQLVTVPMLNCALIFGGMRGLEGRPASLNECLRAGTQRWRMMLGLMVGAGILTFLGFCLLIAPGVLLALRWSVSGPVLVLEGRDIPDSMGRSAELTRDRRGSIFLVFLIYFGIQFVLQAVLGAVGLGYRAAGASLTAALPFMAGAPRPPMVLLLTPLIAVASSLILTCIATTLFRQLRGDKEGGNPEALGEVFA